MRENNYIVVLLLLIVIMPGCAVTQPGRAAVPISTVDSFTLQPPGLGPVLSALQEVTVEFPDNNFEKFLAVVENDGKTLRIALMNMLGQTLVVMSFSDGEVMVDPQDAIPVGMEPVRILGYLQIAMWPQSAVRSGLSGKLSLIELEGYLEIGNSYGPILLVEREGGCCPYATTVITHRLEGWKIHIQTMEQ